MLDGNLTWIDFYTEFADKLLAYRNDREALIKMLRGLFDRLSMKFPKVEADGAVVDLDPFTIYGFFNKGITDVNRRRIAAEIKKDFEIESDIPSDFLGIPVVNNQSATFFYFLRDGRDERDVDNLWDVFEAALNYDKEPTGSNRDRLAETFDIAEQQRGVKWNLTMGLYWCRPERYINLDARNRWFMEDAARFPKEIMGEFQQLQRVPRGIEYLRLCELVRDAFSSGDYEYRSIPEFSVQAWLVSEEVNRQNREVAKTEALCKRQEEGSWWPAKDEYDPGITKDDWAEYLNTDGLLSGNMLAVLKRMKDIGGAATCSQLSQKYGESLGFYRSNGPSAAERIAKVSGCPLMHVRGGNGDSKKCLWPVLFVGKEVPEGVPGTYVWRLRPELDSALNEVDLSRIPLYALKEEGETIAKEVLPYSEADFLREVYMDEADMKVLASQLRRKMNVILQGAPGTGKTYAAKRLAYLMMGECDDSRVKVVQFHQGTAYDDFVCGYRPAEGGGYEVRAGVFVRFCRKAASDPERKYFFVIDEINRANISKVFGELLMLIEKDHRGDEAALALSGESFSVPHNVYLIGMMNTADRGLALIDYALRRRFAFFEMRPALRLPAFRAAAEETGGKRLLALVDAVAKLNDSIAADPALGRGFMIGHSYFCDDSQESDVARAIIRFEIAPLLEEYWFDDPDRANAEIKRLEDAVRDADEQ